MNRFRRNQTLQGHSRKQKPVSLFRAIWNGVRIWRHLKKIAMIEKLKSRKLWVTIISGVVFAIGGAMKIDPETLQPLLVLAASYILGQGAVDAVAAARKEPSK